MVETGSVLSGGWFRLPPGRRSSTGSSPVTATRSSCRSVPSGPGSPHSGRACHPLRPIVEPRRRGPGHRSRAQPRPAPSRRGPPPDRGGSRRGPTISTRRPAARPWQRDQPDSRTGPAATQILIASFGCLLCLVAVARRTARPRAPGADVHRPAASRLPQDTTWTPGPCPGAAPAVTTAPHLGILSGPLWTRSRTSRR